MMYSPDCKFIYVFSEKARDAMIRKGYKLIKSSADQRAYIFENGSGLKFDSTGHDSLKDIKFVKSNTLTF